MTDDEREKFDAIRMTLEFTGHDPESMRARMEVVSAQVTELQIASEGQRAGIQDLRYQYEQDLRYQYEDVRADFRSFATSSSQLAGSIRVYERRITGPEGRIQ
jgi:hypothetical protein